MKRLLTSLLKHFKALLGNLLLRKESISEEKKTQPEKNVFRKELSYEEVEVHPDALEKIRRAIQMAHNNGVQGERMTVSFADGYANRFLVVIGKEEDLLNDDSFKHSRIRERFYFTQREEFYVAIGISEDKLPDTYAIDSDLKLA